MGDILQYAYIDESGSITVSQSSHYLIVAALCVNSDQNISRVVRRVQKKFSAYIPSGELKAKKSTERIINLLLTALSKQPIELYALIVDRQVIEHPTKDPEDIYRWAMARLVAKLVERYPQIEIIVDKRYTKADLRYRLERSMRQGIADLPQRYVLIRHEDSILWKELQAVDFIAWAFFQKYERGDSQFYELIKATIVSEELITKISWR